MPEKTRSVAWLFGRGIPELAEEIRAGLTRFQAARIAEGACDTRSIDRLLDLLAADKITLLKMPFERWVAAGLPELPLAA